MDWMNRYERWLHSCGDEPELLEELRAISGDAAAIEDRFYRELEFGTGGLRGVIGAGDNRMNVYTVARASQGLANYVIGHFPEERRSVAVSYDSRHKSDLFARVASAVFAANGLQVRLYPQLMPTPCLSFAVRELRCAAGVMVTASHNPAKYNGYKVYGPDGCQITTEAAAAILAEISRLDPFADVRRGDFDALLRQGAIRYIDESVYDAFTASVLSRSVLGGETVDRDISTVYSPLNGTGLRPVTRALREAGFTRIFVVPEQEQPDGDFPTCPYPNPEIREAMALGMDYAAREGAELLLATDPDCDRVGAAVRGPEGYRLITGNEMGVLLLDYICRRRLESGTMPSRPVAVKTIVTTPMAARVAEHYGVELIDVLTGFKFIGEQIGLLEQRGEEGRYLFGFEESYGYLSSPAVRDKDAVDAALQICEMFAWHRAHGRSLLDALEELYQSYGFYRSRLLNFAFEGSAGFEKMQRFLAALRSDSPEALAGRQVEALGDYQLSVTRHADGHSEAITLPKSNVLRFFLSGGAEAVVRPSGTEPKLKIYLTAAEGTAEASEKAIDALAAEFERRLRELT